MKASNSILLFAAALAASTLIPLSVRAAESVDAGEYDFGAFAVPTAGGEFVEVDLSRNLIALATHFIKVDEPEVAALLDGLRRVRVHVIGVDDSNREDLGARIERSRTELTQAGWQRVVTVRENRESVDVYVKTKDGETIDGVVVTVLEGDNEAVFVNIVGNIKPEQIVTVGHRFGIEPLKEIRLPAGQRG
jgi:hypothetical protein